MTDHQEGRRSTRPSGLPALECLARIALQIARREAEAAATHEADRTGQAFSRSGPDAGGAVHVAPPAITAGRRPPSPAAQPAGGIAPRRRAPSRPGEAA